MEHMYRERENKLMPLTKEDREILLSQSNSKTPAEWFDFFEGKYTKKQIADCCYHHGKKPKKISDVERSVIQSNNARKYNINQDYFKTWSHNMAYILGLWYADGCIYRGRMFDITLHKKDRYLLKQIAKELEYEGHLYDYVDRQAARIDFSCKVIYDDIVNLGGQECKSMDITFPNSIPLQYHHDFIRGYFDGDGCACLLKNHHINASFSSGSHCFLLSVWDILKKEANIVGGSCPEKGWQLHFGQKDSMKLAHYMYDDNPELFLRRKREKFAVIDSAIGERKNPESY